MILNYIGAFALLSSCGVALRWGGLDERLASLAFILATITSRLFTESNYVHTENMVMVIDAVLLVVLVSIALRSDRYWPMWAAAFQLVGTSVHVASMAETGDFKWAYAVGLIFWTYPVLVALVVGTWLEARHRQRWLQPAE